MRARSWWAKAWLRAVEEAAYDVGDLRRARSTVRAGRVGVVAVEVGALYAAVTDGDDVLTPRVTVPAFDAAGVRVVAEAMAAQAGRLPAVLDGELPYELVEHCDELGAELLPAGGEFAAECPCASWLPVCPHALAVLTSAAARLDAEPLLLLRLRGVGLDDLEAPDTASDLEAAWEAVRAADRLLADDSADPRSRLRDGGGSGTLTP